MLLTMWLCYQPSLPCFPDLRRVWGLRKNTACVTPVSVAYMHFVNMCGHMQRTHHKHAHLPDTKTFKRSLSRSGDTTAVVSSTGPYRLPPGKKALCGSVASPRENMQNCNTGGFDCTNIGTVDCRCFVYDAVCLILVSIHGGVRYNRNATMLIFCIYHELTAI